MGLRPTAAEHRAGLRLASLQGHTRPTEFTTAPNLLPIVRAFVQEKWFARRNTMHVDGMLIQFVREGLLEIQDHAVGSRLVVAKPVKDISDISGIGDRAIE